MQMTTNTKEYMNEYMYGENGYMKSPKKKAENAIRKRARYKLEKQGRVKKFDGKEVDHKNGVTQVDPNAPSNLHVISRYLNRKKGAQKANRNMGNKCT